jgi:hypothetical protein
LADGSKEEADAAAKVPSDLMPGTNRSRLLPLVILAVKMHIFWIAMKTRHRLHFAIKST